MKRRFFQVASGLVCLGFLHSQAFSQKVLVIYNEGMPDNAAPAFLHHMHLGENATLFSVKSLPREEALLHNSDLRKLIPSEGAFISLSEQRLASQS